MRTLFTIFVCAIASIASVAAEPSREGVEFFEKQIRPVLVEHCYKCHSASSEKVRGKLLLDTREGTLKGGETGPAVVPGNLEKSLLITAIRYTHEDMQMPPKQPLTKAQVAAFEQWIKMGAPDPRVGGAAPVVVATTTRPAYDFEKEKRFWSFSPVRAVDVPRVSDAEWNTNAIDAFLFAKMSEKGIRPVGPAEKRVLIRRATYDLTGLPPTPAEVEAFLKDESPAAFANLVERLLASPAYGEKWGRHWLDVIRYADTSGCNSDFPIPDMHRYRNWVINAINADMPYDEFVRQQIAGDLLEHKDVADRNNKIIATGYIANARRFGSRNNEFHLTYEDTIDSIGKGILGLSLSCARCHDHKYDPVPQSDYYALYGIFASTKYAFPGTEIYRHTKDFVGLGGTEEAEKLEKWEAKLAEYDDKYELLVREKDRLESAEKREKELAAGAAKAEPIKPVGPPALGTKPAAPVRTSAQVKAEMFEIVNETRKLEFNPPKVEKAYAVSEGKIGDAKIHNKGDPNNRGADVRRGFLTILGGQKLPADEKGSGRTQLAAWLTDRSNPLTARVMVNRIWQGHFGRGIVRTPNDFGNRGERPTHPELLDHLAGKFMESGWSIKTMHRLIMNSRAYQLVAVDDAKNAAIDPANMTYWRFEPRRLSAEEIRDTILLVANSLDRTMGEEHPFPPEVEWRYTQHKPFVAVYESNKRSIYLMQQRIRKHPFLATFDGADTNAPTGVRPISTTAVQALFMMNDPLVHEQSDKFAARIGLAFNENRQRIDYAYRLLMGRAASSEEIDMGLEYVAESMKKLEEAGVEWDQRQRGALASLARVLFASNEFLFVE